MKKNAGTIKRIYWQKSIAVTIVMMLLVAAVSYLLICWINGREEQKCFEELYEEAGELADEIQTAANSDREELEMLASMIAEYDDPSSKELWDILDSYNVIGMMSRVEILLPGDRMLISGGRSVDVSGKISFEEEASKGAHITGREDDITNDGEYVIRHYAPIVKDGNTVAMLCGVIGLGDLPDEIKTTAYGGEAAIYIIEGENGDFLMDTWHEEPGGNIWGLGTREMAPGYDHQQLKRGLTEGDSNYVVFVSRTTGQYLYFYYTQMDINDWRLALSVPEDVVFEDADQIHEVLNIFMVFEAACFIIYFIWMLYRVRREVEERQRQMDMLSYIYDVQKLLFNSHESQMGIIEALAEIGQVTTAKNVGFWMLERSGELTAVTWAGDSTEARLCSESERKVLVEKLLEYFRGSEKQFEARTYYEIRERLHTDCTGKIENLAAVPVEGMNGQICGVLAGANMKDMSKAPDLLKNVSFGFSMLLENKDSFDAIRARGEKDALTGLYNRNRYEADLKDYERTGIIPDVCIYIDVNGLHRLNNHEGHTAGDMMLKRVAERLRAAFGERHTYRVGGDEFIVFLSENGEDGEEADRNKLKEVTDDLETMDIHVSAGMQRGKGASSVQGLVKEAEKEMYAEKKRYYETSHRSGEGRDPR